MTIGKIGRNVQLGCRPVVTYIYLYRLANIHLLNHMRSEFRVFMCLKRMILISIRISEIFNCMNIDVIEM